MGSTENKLRIALPGIRHARRLALGASSSDVGAGDSGVGQCRQARSLSGFRKALIFSTAFLPVVSVTLAQAQEASKERLFISGVEVSEENNNYGFAAAIVPFKGSSIGNGFVQRYWVEGLSYSYDRGPTEINADAMAVEAALGWQQSHAQGWYAVYAGALYRNTDLSPNDPSSEAQGDHLRLRLQVEGEQRLTQDLRVNAIVSYTAGQEAYWTRVRALHTVSGAIWAGPEFVYHGDDDYKAWQAGAVVGGFQPIQGLDLALKLGARHNQGDDTAPYGGIEVSKGF